MMEGMVKSNKIGQSAAKSLLVREKGSETISKESTFIIFYNIWKK